jgi:chromosome segregation ATPase
MTLTTAIQEKEKRLADRVRRLKAEILTVKKNLTEADIPEKAKEIHSLEIQLQLTERALENTQKQLREHEEKLNSKEYKDKLKLQENLRKQAEKETRTILKNLFEMQEGIQEVNKKLKQFDRLKAEIEGKPQVYGVSYSQPFAWLQLLERDIDKRISDTKFIKLAV